MKQAAITLILVLMCVNLVYSQIGTAFYVGGDDSTYYYLKGGHGTKYLYDHRFGDSISIDYKNVTGSFSYPYVYLYENNTLISVDIRNGEMNDLFTVKDIVFYRKLTNGHLFVESEDVREGEEIVHYYGGGFLILIDVGREINMVVERDGERKTIAKEIGYEDPFVWKQFVAYRTTDDGAVYNLYNIESGENHIITPTETYYAYSYYFDPEKYTIIYENSEYLIEYDLSNFD